jgi:cystathionine beta-lyase
MSKDLSLQTRLLHSDYVAPDGFNVFPPAVQRASTVLFDSVADMRSRRWQERTAYTYGLHGTPTTHLLEAKLAEIEGGKHCMVAPSGLAAIAMVNFAFLKSGDDVLLPDNVYFPNRDMGDWLARDFGVTVRYYDALVGDGIAALIQPNTKLIWTEAPGSITMEIPDIPAICRAAHARGVLVALDNTWAAGLVFNGFEHGVDIVMQALTKYQSGGSDVLMGAVISRDDAVSAKIQLAHARLGFNVGIDDVYLVLRGLDTFKLRFDAHAAAAARIAAFVAQRAEFATLLHPAYPSCPGHAIWQRDFTGAGGLFSAIFDERYTEAQTDRFVDSLQLFKIGYSWGGTHSLCLPYRLQGMRRGWQHKGTLVRFYIGLEDPADLIADIERALSLL